MKSDAQMRSYVMRRVYFMYCTRAVCKPIPRFMILGVLALALVGSVSIVNVVANALHANGVVGLLTFALSAFTDTSLVVQALTIGIAGLISWFVIDTARNIEMVVTPHTESAG